MYRSLVLIKPDAFERQIVGKIFSRFEYLLSDLQNSSITGARLFMPGEETLVRIRQHYAEHADKSFYPGLLTFMNSSPIFALRLESSSADFVSWVRKFIGATDPKKADVGTIRGDLGSKNPESPISRNLVHASDSDAAAQRELVIWGLES